MRATRTSPSLPYTTLFRSGLVYFLLGVGAWVGLLKAGVEPLVVGLVMGALVWAQPAQRSSLERATERFREFREQPTAEDRKSTRLNSSHLGISYAVFCLKN